MSAGRWIAMLGACAACAFSPALAPGHPRRPAKASPESRAPLRDPRPFAQKPRLRLVLSLAYSDQMRAYRAMDKTAPGRVDAMRALAELGVEIEYAAYAGMKPRHTLVARDLAETARKMALRFYRAIEAEYPGYAKLDQVFYFAGYEYERSGDLVHAREMYGKLARRFKNSPYRLLVPLTLR